MAILRNDCEFAPGVCEVSRLYQQPFQLDECCEIDAWRADCHAGANCRIEHPTGDGHHDAEGTLHLKKLACRPLLYETHQNLPAKIGMASVMDFQLLPDMGRMNG
jgi:hypothetical protein